MNSPIRWSNLREIQITHNTLSTLKYVPFRNFPALEIINVSDNKIIDIGSVWEAINIHTLVFDNNNISTIPPELCLLKKLTSLSIYGNPQKAIRFAVCQKGSDAILSYLRNQLVVEVDNSGFGGSNGGSDSGSGSNVFGTDTDTGAGSGSGAGFQYESRMEHHTNTNSSSYSNGNSSRQQSTLSDYSNNSDRQDRQDRQEVYQQRIPSNTNTSKPMQQLPAPPDPPNYNQGTISGRGSNCNQGSGNGSNYNSGIGSGSGSGNGGNYNQGSGRGSNYNSDSGNGGNYNYNQGNISGSGSNYNSGSGSGNGGNYNAGSSSNYNQGNGGNYNQGTISGNNSNYNSGSGSNQGNISGNGSNYNAGSGSGSNYNSGSGSCSNYNSGIGIGSGSVQPTGGHVDNSVAINNLKGEISSLTNRLDDFNSSLSTFKMNEMKRELAKKRANLMRLTTQ